MNRSRVTGNLSSHGNIFVDIANDRVGIGSTIPGQKLSLPDSAKIALGNSADLQLYHDGSTSFIKEAGTGNLELSSEIVILRNAAQNETTARFIQDGSVELYHNGTKKFQTHPDGSEVLGHLLMSDNKIIKLGTSSDLQIYHSGSHSFIDDTGTGNLKLRSNNFRVSNADESKISATFQAAGAVELYHNNSKKLETTANGAFIESGTPNFEIYASTDGENAALTLIGKTASGGIGQAARVRIEAESKQGSNGASAMHLKTRKTNNTITTAITIDENQDINFPIDNQKLKLGAGQDLQLYHTGSNCYISNSTGILYALTDTFEVKGANGNETHLKTTDNGAVELYHNNSKKLETSSSGVTITGTATATSFAGDGSNITAVNAATLDSIDSSSFLRSDADDVVADYNNKIKYYSNSAINTSTSNQASLECFNGTVGNDAFMSFHVGGDFALYFGLDGGINDIAVGGWSMGANSYRVWHAGNDGSGTGLDADTLDGVQGSSFLRSDATDTLTGGTYTFDSSTDQKLILSGSSNPFIRLKEGTTDKAYWQFNSDGNVYLWNQESNTGIRLGSSLNFYDGSYRTIWHSNNDGSGSGLDADLWDGNQFASYLNQALLTSSTVNFTRVNVTGGHGINNDGWFRNTTSGEGLYNNATTQHFYSDNDDYWNIAGGGSANGLRFRDDHAGTIRGYVYANNSNQIGFLDASANWALRVETNGITHLGANGYQIRDGNVAQNLKYIAGANSTDIGISGYNSGGTWKFQLYGSTNYYGFLDANWGGWDIRKQVNGAFQVDEGSGLVTVWNAGNDGAGSGLDSDLLDGQQGSYYAPGRSQGVNQTYVASSTSTSNRGTYGQGVWAYQGYSLGANRPFTYDCTLQVMGNTATGFEISVDWLSQTKTPMKVRSLRDCCQGWSEYTDIFTSGYDVIPQVDDTLDLGSTAKRWRNLYTGDLNLSNKGNTNDVDGTWGSYTIQEGEDDLFLINKRSGKKYKFNLTEVS